MEILWELIVNGNALIGGAALTSIKIRRDADGCYYDWTDATFKNSGWTSLTAALEEVDAVNLPGIYHKIVNTSTWVDGYYSWFTKYKDFGDGLGKVYIKSGLEAEGGDQVTPPAENSGYYCSRDDLEKLIPTQELAELTTETGSSPDATVIVEAIAKADAEIDSYLGMVYAVPLSVVPARVKSLAEDISIYYLYLRRSTVPQARQKAYDDAIAFLKLIAAGTVKLPAATTPTNQGVQLASAASVFDRDSMTSW